MLQLEKINFNASFNLSDHYATKIDYFILIFERDDCFWFLYEHKWSNIQFVKVEFSGSSGKNGRRGA